MKIQTKPYGEIEVNEKQKLFFPDGIIGFEDIKYYFMLDSKEGPYYWLQAEGFPELAFIIINPRIFKDGYKLMVKDEDLKSIDISSPDDMIDFVILTVPEDQAKISANFMGPIIISRKTRKAKQVISENDEYTVKHYIMDEVKSKKEKLVESR